MDKVQQIVDYYVLTNKLKNVVRSGWIQWNVQDERRESVAEHIYGTCMLAVAVWSQTLPSVNLSEVLLMLALHETEEILIGDLTPIDIKYESKKDIGRKAVLEIFKDLKAKDVFVKLLDDFENKSTEEAKFAFKCDKIECDLQAKIYYEQNKISFEKATDAVKNDKRILDMKQKGLKKASSFFIAHDRKNIANYASDDDIFMKLSEYIEKTNITKK